MFSQLLLALIAPAMLTLAFSALHSPFSSALTLFCPSLIVFFYIYGRCRRIALYRQICRETTRMYYNPAALPSNWQQSSLLRRAMRSQKDALRLAQNMLESLHDRHTNVLSKREVEIEASFLVPDVTAKILGDEVGYLKISQFGGEKTATQALHALTELKQTRAIVIDLRNNPGGQLGTVMQIISLFLETGEIATVKQRLPGDPSSPVYHTMVFKLAPNAIELEGTSSNPPSLDRDIMPRLPNLTMGKQLVVLVNEASASASELLAGCLKDHKAATIIGTTTYGKGTGQNVVTLRGGAQLTITTMQFFTPSGLCPGDGSGSGPGIVPHIVVGKNATGGDGAEVDAQLHQALRHLRGKSTYHSLQAPLAADVSLARIFSLLGK